MPILHRDAAGVRLTASGAVLFERGRSVLEDAQALLSDARNASSEASGVLRVIEPVGLPLALHVKVALAAHVAMPRQRITVRHVEDPMVHLREPFELMLHEGPAPDRNLWFSRVILRVPLRPAAPSSYLAAGGAADVRRSGLARHAGVGPSRASRAGVAPARGGAGDGSA